jgi:rsbT co-antagonist protein RsbR
MNHELSGELQEMSAVLEKIEQGDVNVKAREDSAVEGVAKIGRGINQVSNAMKEMLNDSHRMAIGLTQSFSVLSQLTKGDRTARFKGEHIGDEIIDKMAEYINHVAEIYDESVGQSLELSFAIAQFLDVLNQLARGNLKVRAPLDFQTEALAALGKGINLAIEKVSERAMLEELLKELSTPVLHAWEGVIVMPLIGTLTSSRAQEGMEKLLNSIIQYRAKVAIIDITGVPVIDSMVAQHLIKTIKAVKILGSNAIITGISAEVASILVKIGIEIEQFVTRTSLREGIQYAIKLIGEEK